MAFKGDLANITLFDVFQTLNTNRQSGVLVLRREGVMKKIYFSPEGVRIFFTKSARPLRLGEVFVRRGKVTPQDIDILMMQQKQEYRPIGELLVSTGKVSEEEITETLRYHAEDEIFEVFGWERGSFAFFDRDPEDERANTPLSEVMLDAGGLCLEAARRLDDIERLREMVPNDTEYYVQADGAALDREATDPGVIDVFDALVEPNSVNELRDVVCSTQFRVLGALAELRRIELVRPLELDELVDGARAARASGRYERASSLLDEALIHDPHDIDALTESVTVLERIEDPSRLADRLAELGAQRSADGMYVEAIEPLEKAVHHIPAHVQSLTTLRDCFAALGDAEKAADISLRLARIHTSAEDPNRALEAYRAGIAISPDSATLRFNYAQLLSRTDNSEFAQSELRELIEQTLEQTNALRTRRTRDLLTACYTLQLRIDPEDDEARTGLAALQRQSNERVQRRKVMLRAACAGAAVLLLVGVGVTMMPPSAEDLMAEAQAKHATGDIAGAEEIISTLLAEYPESEEALAAVDLRKSFDGGAAEHAAQAKREREKEISAEYQTLLDQLVKQLKTGELGDAVTELNHFLERLAEPHASFLRSRISATLKLELELFLDRAEELAVDDRGFVSACERQVTQGSGSFLVDLANTESKLAEVRRRSWPALATTVAKQLSLALSTGQLKGMEKRVEKVRKSMITIGPAFGGLDPLYFQVRSLHLREKIRTAVTTAKMQGRTLLGRCDFDGALALYRAAYGQADAASQEQPRQYFQDLNNWIGDRKLLTDLGRRIDSIEEVVASLKEFDELVASNREDAAFRLLRDLVSRHRLVQFERRYKLPYRVTSEPSGASVSVDGKLVGKTPCAVTMDIANGIHVRVEAPGFKPVEADLNITDPELDGLLAVTLPKIGNWVHSLRGTPETQPVVLDDLVLVPTNEASLLALRTTDGKVAWEMQTKLLDRIKAPVLVGKDRAYFATSGGRLFEIRISDGQVMHRTDLPGEVHHAGQIAGDTVFFATRNRKLVAVRKGRIVYEHAMKWSSVTGMGRIGDELVMGTAEGVILVHDLRTGKQKRILSAAEPSSFYGGLFTAGNRVIAAAEDGNVYAFQVDRAKPLWKYRVSGALATLPIAHGKLLYLPLRNGFLVRLDEAGEPQDRLDFQNSAHGRPAVHGGFLYMAVGSRLVAFDVQTSRRWWEVEYEEGKPVHVAAGAKLVVTVTDDARVHAYPADSR